MTRRATQRPKPTREPADVPSEPDELQQDLPEVEPSSPARSEDLADYEEETGGDYMDVDVRTAPGPLEATGGVPDSHVDPGSKPSQETTVVPTIAAVETPKTDRTQELAMELAVVNAKLELLLSMRNNASMTPNSAVDKGHASAVKRNLIKDARKSVGEYNGEHNPSIIETFLTNFVEYAEESEFTDASTIRAFGKRLKGKARSWWTYFKDCTLPDLGVDTDGKQWPIVEKAFRAHFMPVHYQVEQIGKWHELKMDGGLLNYIRQFRLYMHRLPEVPEFERWNALVYKIDQKAKDFLSLKEITTSEKALEALYEYALGHEKDNRRRQRVVLNVVNSKSTSNKRSAPPSRSSHQDKRGRSDRSDRSAYEHIAVDMTNYNNFQAIPRLTKNLIEFLEKHRGCRYCRKLNVPAEHTPTKCANERHQQLGKSKDF